MNEPEGVTPAELLDALWDALKDNYPAFEFVVGVTGDAWRDEFRARLIDVTSLPDTYPALEELVNRFHDYHTSLHWPDKPSHYSPAGLRLGWVEGVVAVVTATTVPAAPLMPGDVLLARDGEDVGRLYQQRLTVARGATQYARQSWACDTLLEGDAGTTVSVRVQRGGGGSRETLELECVRTMPSPRESLESFRASADPVEVRREAADVGYILIPSWQPSSETDLLTRFDAALEEFRELPCLLLDVRNNRGGSDALADKITGRFLRGPIVSSISFHREVGTQRYQKTVETAHPRGPWRFGGRVAVLTNEDCASACEHFVSGMRASGAALLVGRPTTGACGWRKSIPLPGGSVLYCSLTIPFHGAEPSPLHGIAPDRLVLPTLEALRAGRDLVIEEAVASLRAGDGMEET